MPAAARVGDQHVCYKTEPVVHNGGEILEPGSRTVFIGQANAACVGDKAWCEGGVYDVIVTGEPTVLIGERAAARLGDATEGGHVTSGCTTVLIGPPPMVEVLREAARSGTPFCEKIVRVRLEERDG
ncbi:PAAR domain-containing protein [Sorangium sp. So ce388]|uniref:PAAR domain-containing protein n=1 Tax=Sorangium sp. So ce388 TaxID=3133309 RepID=UPI003F5BD7D0